MQQTILIIIFIAAAILCLCIFVPCLARNGKLFKKPKIIITILIILGIVSSFFAINQIFVKMEISTATNKAEPIQQIQEMITGVSDEKTGEITSVGYVEIDEINDFVNRYIVSSSDIEYLVGIPSVTESGLYDFSYGFFEKEKISEIKSELANMTINNSAYSLAELAQDRGILVEILFCNLDDNTPVSFGGFLKWYDDTEENVWLLLGDDYCFKIDSDIIENDLDGIYEDYIKTKST